MKLFFFFTLILFTFSSSAYCIEPLTLIAIGAGVSAVSSLATAGMSVYNTARGDTKARKEHARAETLNRRLFAIERGDEARMFDEEMALREKEFGHRSSIERNQQAMNFMTSMSKGLLSQPNSLKTIASVQRRRT